MDRAISDEFSDSDEFGVDRTAPTLDELQPPQEDPAFVWNPDLTGTGCPDAAPGSPDCETIMWESIDPDLASGDLPETTPPVPPGEAPILWQRQEAVMC